MNTKNTQNAFGLYCRTTVGGAALLASMIGLAACSDSDSSDNNSAPYEMKTVAAADKLPSCTDSNVGQMAYIESTQEVVYCAQNNWLTMKGADGKDGASCSVKSSDKGYDVYCGSELVGTLSNGSDGAAGKDGVDGKDGKDGAAGKDGVNGKDGTNGLDGKDGVNGKDGTNGLDGKDGADGKDGTNGLDGKDGADGKDGTNGLDGKDGQDGAPGTSCIATMLEDESGAAISCGGEYVGTIYNGLNGDKGDPGENCTVTDAFNGNVTITCDNESVTVFKAMCFTNAYDPDSLVCIRGKLFKPCELDAESDYRFIDTTTHFCQVTRDDNGKITAAKAYGKCKVKVDGQDELASVTYDPEKQFCANNADENLNDYSVQDLCGTDKKTFLPKTQFCAAEDKDVHDLCDIINAEKKHELVKYDPTTQFCANNKNADLNDYSVQDLCINGSTKATFYPKTQFCATQDNKVHDLCKVEVKGQTDLELVTYDPTTQFCANNKTEALNDYSVQDLCINGSTKATFYPKTQFCAEEDNKVYDKCDVAEGKSTVKKIYNPITQFCAAEDKSIQYLCGRDKFDPTKKFCWRDETDSLITDICQGNPEYNPKQYKCALTDNSLPKTYELIKYVKVGDQVWMAENRLKGDFVDNNDYETGIKTAPATQLYYYCYKNKQGNCYTEDEETKAKTITGGGLYTFKVARRVCPVGWHLPSKPEFETLLEVMGLSSSSGLITMSGYNYNISRDTWENFWSNPTETRFWSRTPDGTGKVYTVYMDNGTVKPSEQSFADVANYVASVRCLEGEIEEQLCEETPQAGVESCYDAAYNLMYDYRDATVKTYKTAVPVKNSSKTHTDVWMAENLDYTTAEGSENATYGKLYTWTAASSACPKGWHLPTDAEWANLAAVADAEGYTLEEALKSTSVDAWGTGAVGVDAYKFTALPAGGKWYDNAYVVAQADYATNGCEALLGHYPTLDACQQANEPYCPGGELCMEDEMIHPNACNETVYGTCTALSATIAAYPKKPAAGEKVATFWTAKKVATDMYQGVMLTKDDNTSAAYLKTSSMSVRCLLD